MLPPLLLSLLTLLQLRPLLLPLLLSLLLPLVSSFLLPLLFPLRPPLPQSLRRQLQPLTRRGVWIWCEAAPRTVTWLVVYESRGATVTWGSMPRRCRHWRM